MCKVTIFTPSYNRASTLDRLYQSILRQNFKQIEWLIVDDGSTDNTKEQVTQFINENRLSIQYIIQENGGKHRAVNNGLRHARGELFFIVDSDDYLTDDSLESVLKVWKDIENDPDFAGVVGFRQYENGRKIGGGMKYETLDSNLIDRRYKYNIQGDLAKVLKTDVFRKFPFPDIAGEYFVAESVVWNRIAGTYKFRYFNKAIYVGEYLEGGLSESSIRNRRKNPNYACLIYKELANNKKVPLKYKIKAILNYWRFAFCKKGTFMQKLKEIENYCWSIFLLPFGYILNVKDKFNNKVNININK